jgi:predicted nucleic acid-binding protein
VRADAALTQAYLDGEVWISRQILRELTKALLTTSIAAGQLDHSWVFRAVRTCLLNFRICDEGQDVLDTLLELIEKRNLPPRLVHDANIVATMLTNGVSKLITNDKSDFVPLSDLVTIVEI